MLVLTPVVVIISTAFCVPVMVKPILPTNWPLNSPMSRGTFFAMVVQASEFIVAPVVPRAPTCRRLQHLSR